MNSVSKVFNCDNMEYMKTIPNKWFELAIVDPPYGIGEDGGKVESRNVPAFGKGKVKVKEYTKKNWDNYAPGEDYFLQLQRISKNQIIFGANHFIEKIPNSNSSCWIVWDKDNGNNDFADCELAWTSFKTAVRKIKFKWHGMLQEHMNASTKEKRIHPTQKPVGLYLWLLEKYAKDGDKIFDSHLGSGSSRIAALEYCFDFYGCELDKEYFDLQEKRFSDEVEKRKLFLPTKMNRPESMRKIKDVKEGLSFDFGIEL